METKFDHMNGMKANKGFEVITILLEGGAAGWGQWWATTWLPAPAEGYTGLLQPVGNHLKRMFVLLLQWIYF